MGDYSPNAHVNKGHSVGGAKHRQAGRWSSQSSVSPLKSRTDQINKRQRTSLAIAAVGNHYGLRCAFHSTFSFQRAESFVLRVRGPQLMHDKRIKHEWTSENFLNGEIIQNK